MMSLLLDVLPYGDDHYRRPIRKIIVDTIRNHKPVQAPAADTASTGTAVPDTASATQQVADTASATQDAILNVGNGGDDTSMLWWSLFFVLLVLALCLYLAFSYRRSLKAVNG